MTGLQFAAALVDSLAWPAAVVAVAILLRRELVELLHRLQSLKFPGGEVMFALQNAEKVVADAARDAEAQGDGAAGRQEIIEFSPVVAMSSTAPRQAVIDAWGLLEYQLNVASDRVAPDKPHGWPQVAVNLEAWDKWPMLYPAVLELRHLRDYTVESPRPPSSADAARYVSVAQDLATVVRAWSIPGPGRALGGADE